MANITITFPAEADLTLRAFPDEQYGVSLADWGTDAKVATQSDAPNKGKYTATLDDTYRYWAVFIGAGQPNDWGLAEYLVDIHAGILQSTDFSDSALAKINQHRRS